MPPSIVKKITSFQVKTVDTPSTPTALLEREGLLEGKTYKIKPPNSEHAVYITINDQDGKPYEIFLNCKCPESHSWFMATTRLISAILRTGHDPTFMVNELKDIADPKGGYFYPREGYIASIQAHIGLVLERHLCNLSEVSTTKTNHNGT